MFISCNFCLERLMPVLDGLPSKISLIKVHSFEKIHSLELQCLNLQQKNWSCIVAQWKRIQLVIMRMGVQSLGYLSESGIRCCHELWCRLKMPLGSCIAVAVGEASKCSSDSTPSLGTSICHGCGPKKSKTKQTNKGKLCHRWKMTEEC